LLTATGKDQCLQLRNEFPFSQEVSLVLASPLQRTIQTAAWTFGPELEKRQLLFLLVPHAQEISGLQCDFGWDEAYVRSNAPNLISEAAPGFDTKNLDSTLVDSTWNSKVTIDAYQFLELSTFRTDLYHRKGSMPRHYLPFAGVLPNCDNGSGIVQKSTSR
jgi:hypothetical protein